jgi:DeoR family transcriptional regulator, copper-sensing transcriptional repressor
MLPIERQQQILTWIKEEKSLRVSELSERLHVSEMTVYRDLKPLIEQQKVLKTSNGIVKAPSVQNSTKGCSYCFKESITRHSVQIITIHQQVVHACCAHCGLLYYAENEGEIAQILCKDFLHDTTLSAKAAAFILDANLNLNCCHPQVIAFGSYTQAENFQRGFGGEIHHFLDAIHTLEQKMNGNCHCSQS